MAFEAYGRTCSGPPRPVRPARPRSNWGKPPSPPRRPARHAAGSARPEVKDRRINPRDVARPLVFPRKLPAPSMARKLAAPAIPPEPAAASFPRKRAALVMRLMRRGRAPDRAVGAASGGRDGEEDEARKASAGVDEDGEDRGREDGGGKPSGAETDGIAAAETDVTPPDTVPVDADDPGDAGDPLDPALALGTGPAAVVAARDARRAMAPRRAGPPIDAADEVADPGHARSGCGPPIWIPARTKNGGAGRNDPRAHPGAPPGRASSGGRPRADSCSGEARPRARSTNRCRVWVALARSSSERPTRRVRAVTRRPMAPGATSRPSTGRTLEPAPTTAAASRPSSCDIPNSAPTSGTAFDPPDCGTPDPASTAGAPER
jgi:hypothetical protein